MCNKLFSSFTVWNEYQAENYLNMADDILDIVKIMYSEVYQESHDYVTSKANNTPSIMFCPKISGHTGDIEYSFGINCNRKMIGIDINGNDFDDEISPYIRKIIDTYFRENNSLVQILQIDWAEEQPEIVADFEKILPFTRLSDGRVIQFNNIDRMRIVKKIIDILIDEKTV